MNGLRRENVLNWIFRFLSSLFKPPLAHFTQEQLLIQLYTSVASSTWKQRRGVPLSHLRRITIFLWESDLAPACDCALRIFPRWSINCWRSWSLSFPSPVSTTDHQYYPNWCMCNNFMCTHTHSRAKNFKENLILEYYFWYRNKIKQYSYTKWSRN